MTVRTGGGGATVGSGLRAMRRELVAAQVEKVARVVAMVDALPRRGDADALIEPLRPRLAQMRVSRPLSLARLLFIPLEPVLMDGRDWRRGGPGVPRTVLSALAGIVRHGLGPEAAGIDARLAGRTTADRATIRAEGAMLWPRAAAILNAAPMQPDWAQQTGLAAADHATLCRSAALVLVQAAPLSRAVGAEHEAEAQGGADAPPSVPQVIEATLAQPQAADAAALATVVAAMLAQVARADAVLDALQSQETEATRPALRLARDHGVEFALAQLAAPRALAGALADASEDVHRGADLLDELAGWAVQRPGQRARVEEARRALDASCRTRFGTAVEQGLSMPSGAPGRIAEDSAVRALEHAARDLRRFEQAARRVGSGAFYDRALREATTSLTSGGPDNPLTPMDRVRMTELLVGAEEALALLSAG